MKFLSSVFIILSLSAALAFGGEMREIELKDGSVISGEVLSLTGGVYTIKSDSLGTIKLEESKIRAIRSKGAGTPPSGPGADTRGLQDKMMSDKEVMSLIQSLQSDPEFQKVLEDPEIMKAVQAGDVAALMANPQFMKLLNNSTVKEIGKKVK